MSLRRIFFLNEFKLIGITFSQRLFKMEKMNRDIVRNKNKRSLFTYTHCIKLSCAKPLMKSRNLPPSTHAMIVWKCHCTREYNLIIKYHFFIILNFIARKFSKLQSNTPTENRKVIIIDKIIKYNIIFCSTLSNGIHN